jgi:hypothetical protein
MTMLSRIKEMAVIAAIVLTTASAALAEGDVKISRPTADRGGHELRYQHPSVDRGYDGNGCTNYFRYLYDAADCDPR